MGVAIDVLAEVNLAEVDAAGEHDLYASVRARDAVGTEHLADLRDRRAARAHLEHALGDRRCVMVDGKGAVLSTDVSDRDARPGRRSARDRASLALRAALFG